MALYRVVKKWQYTEVVEVEADTKTQAEGLAVLEMGEIRDDDTLYSVDSFLVVGEDK